MYARNAGDDSVAVWQDCGGPELMEMLQGLAFVTCPSWKEVHPPIHIDSDRNHSRIFTKIGCSN